ncbi:MAG: hypothetical protein HY308_07400 [Gammaproteobacteria bacterium]|nr:hypothetical protein [Gammaproteobacteria bacterium]
MLRHLLKLLPPGARGCTPTVGASRWILSLAYLVLAMFAAPPDASAAVTITSATLTYNTQVNQASVRVTGSGTISATMNVTITGNTGNDRWQATLWTIGTSSGCFDNANHNGAGTYSETFNITAPAAAGTYNVVFQVDKNDCGGGGVVATSTLTGGAIVDNTPPTIPTATITSNNANPLYAKVGDTVTLSFTTSSDVGGVQTPVVTIGVGSATVSGGPTSWTATYVMTAGDTDGTVPFNISVSDLAGNSATRTAITSGSNVTFDKTAPTLPTATITSNNANPLYAKVGDVVTLSFTTNDTNGVQTPTVTIGAGSATVSGGPTSWTATRTMTVADTDGTVTFAINVNDVAGNAATARTAITSGSNVTFDKTAPAVTSITRVDSNPTGAASVSWTVVFGESVTGVGSSDFALAAAGVSGASITLVSGSGTTYTVTAGTGTDDGTLGLNLVDDDSIVDAVGNPVGGTGAGNGNFTGQVYTITRISSFNVVEPAANAVTGKIYPKIAGQNFSLDVVALDSANAVATSFTGVVAVEVVDNTSGGACSGLPVIATFTNQTFVGGDVGRHSLSSPNTVANVYRNARIRVTYPVGAPTVTACSIDNFTIRPSSFSFSASDANRTTEGTTNTLNNASMPGGTVHNAGRPFRITATPYNGAGTPAVTSNYDGTPTAVVTTCGGSGCPTTAGTLTLGAWSLSGGVATTTTASYTEVGALSLQLEDSTYASVDAADGSSAAQRTISSTATDIGRFVPDHFDTSVTHGCAAGSFTYSAQSFQVTVIAYNSAGAITTNFKNPAAGGVASAVTLANAGSSNPGSFSNGSFAAASFANGVQTRTDVAYTFTTKETAPLTGAGGLKVRATDADSADSSGGTEGSTAVRGGRIQIKNAFGSELLPLSVTLEAQYYKDDTDGFITNTNDTCTGLAVGALTLTPVPATAPTIANNPLVAGDAGLSFAAPGVGNGGSIDVTVGLGAYTWLRYDWDGDGADDDDPSGRVTFGIFKGNRWHIYRRERY